MKEQERSHPIRKSQTGMQLHRKTKRDLPLAEGKPKPGKQDELVQTNDEFRLRNLKLGRKYRKQGKHIHQSQKNSASPATSYSMPSQAWHTV
ncbi:hypothetical protein JTB14_033074 [Gonioctena quinquepunctata]|nr:hypothetical protein JTB14_033074 [Gonioctena quinquepunctata]